MTVDSRTLDRSQLQAKVLPELQQIAESLGVTSHQRLKKGDLIDAIIAKMPTDGQETAASGNGEPKTMERRREEQVGEEGQQASAETATGVGSGSARSGRKSLRTPRSGPGSSMSSPKAMASCGPADTSLATPTCTCRCRRSEDSACAAGTRSPEPSGRLATTRNTP